MENNTDKVHITIGKNYDSEFCGSIPLHLVNLIQPHGMLLVLDETTLQMVQVSENVGYFFGTPVEELLGKPLSRYLPEEQFSDLKAKIGKQSSQEKIPYSLTFSVQGKQASCTALVHQEEGYLLIELEENPLAAPDNSFIGLYQQVRYITSLLKQVASISEIAGIAASEIKKLTGFDRVLVYQFDSQWNGIVIAEEKEKDLDAYLDLRFPASDVPKQARDLYFRNPYRLIPNRDYTPVRLIPIINPLTQRFTNLSDCNLRSVATVHLEYLTNLGVSASMSLPLIIENKLWGLISLHHKIPRNPSYEVRSALELLSDIVAAQLAAKEREKAILIRAQLQGLHAKLMEQLYNSHNFADGLLLGSTNIQNLLKLTGAAILFDGGVWTSGNTPGPQELKELVSWLRRNKINKLYATDTLPKQYIQSKDYSETASGLIVMPINAELGEFILGFRQEVLETVRWGGDPNQAIQMEPDGKTYHPRNSFATYQETVRYTSQPWLDEEIVAAETLRSAVLEKILREKY